MTSSHSIEQTLSPGRRAVRASGDGIGKTLGRVYRRISGPLGLLCVLSLTGCTTIRIEPTVRPLPGLPRPDRALLHDFELTPPNAERNWDILPQSMRSAGAVGETGNAQVGGTVVKVFADSLIQ